MVAPIPNGVVLVRRCVTPSVHRPRQPRRIDADASLEMRCTVVASGVVLLLPGLLLLRSLPAWREPRGPHDAV